MPEKLSKDHSNKVLQYLNQSPDVSIADINLYELNQGF